MDPNETLLQVKSISHSYGSKAVLKDVRFSLKKGEIGCILGPSGSGKTTILRAIAGLEEVDSGEVCIKGQCFSSQFKTIRPESRGVGIVFQDYALFPHLTVRQNIEIAVRMLTENEKKKRTDLWLERIGLSSIASSYPHQVSGGEAQRVALARALVSEPALVLLDEPFSNLDVDLKESLREEVRKILKENKMTALLVTHDQDEAFAMADAVGVFNEGKIVQWGTPYELYHEPVNRFVADFVGQGVFVKGKLIQDLMVKTDLGELKADDHSVDLDGDVVVLIRPDDVIHDDDSPFQARVIHKAFRGAYILYTLELNDGQKVLSYVHSHHNHEIGSSIGIRIEADHVVCFKEFE